jgi:isopentenyl-diphosphate delta-isomerase
MKDQEGKLGTDEYLDVVDDEDRVIGKRLRSQLYHEHASNFRVINAFIKNSKGQLWIPTRSPDKKLSPNALDFSVGGHVESGESYDAALQREAQEELALNAMQLGARLLGKLTPQDGVAAFMQVYEIITDKTPIYSATNFSSGEWMYPHELNARILRGTAVKSDLPIVLRRFYQTTSRRF